MFPIPEVLSVPVFSGLGSGAVLYPTVGVVLAGMLIAAFVGSALGVLREGLRSPERRRADRTNVTVLPVPPVARARECREAA